MPDLQQKTACYVQEQKTVAALLNVLLHGYFAAVFFYACASKILLSYDDRQYSWCQV